MADLSLEHHEFPIRLPLQRRRVWRACECCRRKKIKCDGREPVCSQCTQTNSTCNWVQTKDRAALSRHYVQELEARLIQMEGLLTQVGTSASRPDSMVSAPPPSRKQQLPATPTSQPTARPQQRRPSNDVPTDKETSSYLDPSVNQAPAEPDHFGQLAMDHNGHLRWIGGSAAMTLVDAFRNISNRSAKSFAKPGARTNQPEGKTAAHNLYFPPIFRSDVRALPGPEQAEFPPRDLADKLVAAYFTHFHHTLPVVDSTAFLSQYRRLMDERRISSPSEIGFAIVVFAVFACAARFVTDARLTNKEPDRAEAGTAAVYYERAMILYYIGHTATQLAHVQAFVLLASFLASINSLPQAWLMCGQAVRIAQDLGLHRSPKHLLLTPIDKETRRKVWWCVYGLDRMLAVALGRPLGIDDVDCDVELPLDIDDVALPKYFASLSPGGKNGQNNTVATAEVPITPSLMKGFNALTCLFKIAGQVLRSVYALDKCKENLDEDKMAELQASVDRLDKLLTEWCEKLPAPFKSNPQTSQQVSLGAILCSCYYAVTVTLHRNFIPTSVGSRQVPRSSSVAKAVTASRSCIFLAQSIKDVIPSSHWLAFFSQYLFSSAVIILLCIMHATDQNAVTTAMSEVNAAIECLTSLESFWPGAKRCTEILKELADMTLSRLQNGVTPSPVPASDWFVTDGTTIRSPGRHLGHQIAASPGIPVVPSQPESPALSGSLATRKRTIDDVAGTELPHPLQLAPGKSSAAVTSMPPPSSPSGTYGRRRASNLASPSSVLAFHAAEDLMTEASSYSISVAANSPQLTQTWSTPRSSSAAMSQDNGFLPLDLTTLSPAGPNPFSISFGTPPPSSSTSTTTNVPLDSAYLPAFAYPMTQDNGMPAPSPSQFDLSDLPFSGMDFLQTLGDSFQDTSGTEQNEVLWAQLGASPFKLAPDLPFSVIDGNTL